MQWEYLTLMGHGGLTAAQQLDDYGKYGWELVDTVVVGVDGHVLYFKRRIFPKWQFWRARKETFPKDIVGKEA